MSDIFNIPNWAVSTLYEVDDIVLNSNNYYYALERHTSSSAFSTDAAKWGGTLNYGGEVLPFFIWKPSYGYRIPVKPAVKTISFGDNYKQDLADGINNVLLTLNLSFENRDLKQTRAILHFLNIRKGAGKFFFIPASPYSVVKKFVCLEFDSGQDFYEKYGITAVFEERV